MDVDEGSYRTLGKEMVSFRKHFNIFKDQKVHVGNFIDLFTVGKAQNAIK